MSEPAAVIGLCTLREAATRITASLRDAGFDAPEREARALVLAATEVPAARYIAEPLLPLDPAQSARLEAFLARRLQHEPLSRIRGWREFFGRPFRVTPDTLDPRPDTETLIEAALEIAAERGWRDAPLRIIDVGTGTGCLLLTLLAELPKATGLGTDVSWAALAVAHDNAVRLGLEARAEFRTASALDGIHGPFDLLVSNPPYISTDAIGGLEPAVRDYDPRAALEGGFDGLDVYRAIACGLGRCVPDGVALFEIGAGQAPDVASILAAAGQGTAPRLWSDLGGHIRTVAVSTHQP